LSGGQTGRQKAAQAENYRSKPLTRDASILHRNHYVHHSYVYAIACFPKSRLVVKSGRLALKKKERKP